MRFLTATALLALATFGAAAESADSLARYLPEIHGALRGRWEILTDDGRNRFQLRNARVILSGNLGAPIDYYLQTDLCNAGKMEFLDGWARLSLADDALRVKAGQFRVPFGVDPFRGPATYIFANRSFIGRDIANLRAVGVSVAYSLPFAPVTVEAGVFNSTKRTDQTTYNHDKVTAVKAVARIGDFTVAGGFQSIVPDGIRINMADASVSFSSGRWLAEAEYVYKHYTGHAHRPCHAYNVFANYTMPIKAWVFRQLSVQARADGSTAHSDGRRDDNGLLTDNHPSRNRLTFGSTLTYRLGRLRCDVRLNYEKYLYHDGFTAPGYAGDKVVAELVVAL